MHNKKAFTIVELVIVIAIIAILAAVLIPTFASLISAANVSADQQLVKNINTALATEEVLSGKNPTFHDAIADIDKAGYTVERLTPTAEGYNIVWDQDADKLALLNPDKTVAYSEGNALTTVAGHVWMIVKDQAEFDANKADYSLYLAEGFAGTDLDVTNGIDVGNNTGITAIDYENTTATAKNVIIRTNGGTLNVTAPLDTVRHYNEATNVNIIAIAGASFHENGKITGNLNVFSGHAVMEKGAEVNTVIISTSTIENPIVPSVTLNDDSKVSTIVINNSNENVKVEVSSGAQIASVVPGNALTDEQAQQVSTKVTGVDTSVISTEKVELTSAIKVSGGIGTESSPFIINSFKDWDELRRFYQTKADTDYSNYPTINYSDKKAYYWSVTTDLDFSQYTEKYPLATINYFRGNIDFNNHTVRGLEKKNIGSSTFGSKYGGLFFSPLGDVTISNLKYEISNIGTDNGIRVVDRVESVKESATPNNLTLKNVDVYGSVQYADNNASVYIHFVNGNSSINFIDCDNYANIANNGLGTAVFVGGEDTNYTTNTKIANNVKLSFTNCSNSGMIDSNEHSSMLIANPVTIINSMNLENLTISNCTNRGQIYCPTGKTAYYINSSSEVTALETKLIEDGELTNDGFMGEKSTALLSSGTDNKIIFKETANAASYKFVISVFAKDAIDLSLVGQFNMTFDVTDDTFNFYNYSFLTGIDNTYNKLKNNSSLNTVIEGSYYTLDNKNVFKCSGYDDLYAYEQPIGVLYAYDSEGNILSTYQYIFK